MLNAAFNKSSARFDSNQACIPVPMSGKNEQRPQGAKFFVTLNGSELVRELTKIIQVHRVYSFVSFNQSLEPSQEVLATSIGHLNPYFGQVPREESTS